MVKFLQNSFVFYHYHAILCIVLSNALNYLLNVYKPYVYPLTFFSNTSVYDGTLDWHTVIKRSYETDTNISNQSGSIINSIKYKL